MGYTIIVPVYNEEKIIEKNSRKLLKFLDNLQRGEEYEIILYSNGSTDSTIKKGRKLQEKFPGKIRFCHQGERGVGSAFSQGVRLAKFGKIISLDMDLSVDLKFVPSCLELLDNQEVDIVVGSKKMGNQRRSLFRKIASRSFIFLTRMFLGLDFEDYSIAAKGYQKEKIEKYLDGLDGGSSYVLDLLYYGQRSGLTIKEIPVSCEDNRKSKFDLYHEIPYRLKSLLKLWLTNLL